MRIFESKQGQTIKLEKKWVRIEQVQFSSSDVLVYVFSTATGFEDPPAEDYTLYTREMIIAGEKAILNPVTQSYEFDVTINDTWGLGLYLVRWNGTILGGPVREYDKLYVIGATRADLADAINMPSSVSVNGISINYSQRIEDMKSLRPAEVGRLTKRRNRMYPDTFNKDYPGRKK